MVLNIEKSGEQDLRMFVRMIGEYGLITKYPLCICRMAANLPYLLDQDIKF